MVRPRVRRKAKNSKAIVRRKDKHKRIKVSSTAPLIKEKWDRRLTVNQNYRRLGILSSLKGYTGVDYNSAASDLAQEADLDSLEEKPQDLETELNPEIEVSDSARKIGLAINSRAKEIKFKEVDESYLKAISEEITKSAQKGPNRITSAHEAVILGKLLDKHGLDYDSMAKDTQLNRFQLTAGNFRQKFLRIIESIDYTPLP